MLRVVAALVAVAVGATVVHAQNLDAIKQRRDVMKVIGTAGTTNFQMLKGEAPFELAKVQASLKSFLEGAEKFKSLFPDDSKTGGDTDAAPKIWQSRAEFDAAINGFIDSIKTAAGGITDEATFKVEYAKFARSCGACHNNTDGFAPGLAASFKKLKQ